MFVEKLRRAAKAVGWEFNNGAGHWQNLQDLPDDGDLPFEEKTIYLLLLWNDRELKLNNYNAIEGYEFEGEAVLCVRSRLTDPDYNFKYDEHISKLRRESERLFNKFSTCEEWRVKRWKDTEVENQYDTNVDGIKIRFSISYE